MTLTTPLLGTVCHRQLEHGMINLPTKFEVPTFTRYGNMKDIAKRRKWGGLGQLGIIQGNRKWRHSIERIRVPVSLP